MVPGEKWASDSDLIGKIVRALETIQNGSGSKLERGYIATVVSQHPRGTKSPTSIDVSWGVELGYVFKPFSGHLSDVPITVFCIDDSLGWSWYPRFEKPTRA
jgi:hypothetical protein